MFIVFNTLDIDNPYTTQSNKIIKEDTYSDSWAVIIGINEYEHVDKLNYADQDAEAIKNLLV